jgi:hypothetical protein
LDNNPNIIKVAYGDYYYTLGDYYFNNDNFIEAKNNYEKAFSIYGDKLSSIKRFRNIICNYLIENNANKTIQDIEKFKTQNNNPSWCSTFIYLLKYNSGNFDSAKKTLFDQLEKLILENPLGLEDYSKDIPPQQNATLLKLEMAQTEESYRKFLQSYFPKWQPEFERFVEIYVRMQKGPDYQTFSQTSVLTYQMIAEKPIVADLPRLKMPTLLIIGQQDRTVFGRRFAPPEAVKLLGNFPKLGENAAKIIPHAKLVPLANVGHIPHIEVPELFNETVLNFLKNSKKKGRQLDEEYNEMIKAHNDGQQKLNEVAKECDQRPNREGLIEALIEQVILITRQEISMMMCIKGRGIYEGK